MLYYYYHCNILVVCIRPKDDGKAAKIFVVAKFVDIIIYLLLFTLLYI